MAERKESDADGACLICTNPLNFAFLGECDHRAVCAPCGIRLREIYDDKKCIVCKSDQKKVVLTTSIAGVFAKYDFRNLKFDQTWKVYYDDASKFEDVVSLREIACPKCDRKNFKDASVLTKHLKVEHQTFFCDICLKKKKCFLKEQATYSKKSLNAHLTSKDTNGKETHPACQFCNMRFYDDNDLYEHLHSKHFHCQVCDGVGVRNVYFNDYSRLRDHYEKEHFPCPEPECISNAHIVFATEIDLKAHLAREHKVGSGMSRNQRNAAMAIPVSFTYSSSRSGGAQQGRGQRGGRRDEYEGLDEALRASTVTAAHEAVQQRLQPSPPPQTNDFPSLPPSVTEAPPLQPGSWAGLTVRTASKGQKKRQKAKAKREAAQEQAWASGGQSTSAAPVVVEEEEEETTVSPVSTAYANATQEEISARNKNLMGLMVRYLNDDKEKLRQVKDLSAKFRAGGLGSDSYYRQLLGFFGRDGSVVVIPELIALLPDAAKRKELQIVHSDFVHSPDSFPTLGDGNQRFGGDAAPGSTWSSAARIDPSLSRADDFPILRGADENALSSASTWGETRGQSSQSNKEEPKKDHYPALGGAAKSSGKRAVATGTVMTISKEGGVTTVDKEGKSVQRKAYSARTLRQWEANKNAGNRFINCAQCGVIIKAKEQFMHDFECVPKPGWQASKDANGADYPGLPSHGPSASPAPQTEDDIEASRDLEAKNKAMMKLMKQYSEGNEKQFEMFRKASAQFRQGKMNPLQYHQTFLRTFRDKEAVDSLFPMLMSLLPDQDLATALGKIHDQYMANQSNRPKDAWSAPKSEAAPEPPRSPTWQEIRKVVEEVSEKDKGKGPTPAAASASAGVQGKKKKKEKIVLMRSGGF